MMPMTVVSKPSSLMDLPTTSGSAAKRRSQKPWASMATRSAPGRSSPSTNPRPRATGLLQTSKTLAVTSATNTRVGSSTPVSTAVSRLTAAIAENAEIPSR